MYICRMLLSAKFNTHLSQMVSVFSNLNQAAYHDDCPMEFYCLEFIRLMVKS